MRNLKKGKLIKQHNKNVAWNELKTILNDNINNFYSRTQIHLKSCSLTQYIIRKKKIKASGKNISIKYVLYTDTFCISAIRSLVRFCDEKRNSLIILLLFDRTSKMNTIKHKIFHVLRGCKRNPGH